ncbi:MAG: polysaccharide biosynthesis protein [Anaerolineae bacterium]|nr:polysaccharide biosynthesis protein [Anaerolineae bacterium]
MVTSQHQGFNHQMLRRVIRRVIADSLIVTLSYMVALFYFYMTHHVFLDVILQLSWFLIGSVIVLVYLTVNAILGFYQRVWGSGSVLEPLWLLVSTGLATLLLYELSHLLFSLLYRFDLFPVILMGGNLTCIGFLGIRYRLFIWRRLKCINHNAPSNIEQSRVLIVGMTYAAQQLAAHLMQDKLQHFQIVGFIDHDPTRINMIVQQWPVLGAPADIPCIAAEKKIDVIVVVQNGILSMGLDKLLNLCQDTSAQIKILPDGLDVLENRRWDLSVLRDVTIEDLLGRKQAESDKTPCCNMVRGKVVLVTGASGSIGSELCRQLSTFAPARLILLDNNESALHDLGVDLQKNLNCSALRLVLGDITHGAKMKELFETEHPHLVFHAAAYKHVPMLELYPEEAVRVNILGTMILSEYAARYDVEHFVFISTDKAVNPSSVMGASKRICELWIAALSHIAACTTYTTVRFGNVIGSRGSVVPIFKRQIEWGGPLTLTHPEMTRYFMSIPEAVSLVLHAMTLDHQSDIYMLDMGEQVSILELARRMIRLRGLRVNHDIYIQYTGIRPGEKLHEELIYGNEVRQSTNHKKVYRLQLHKTAPDLKNILGAMLLLADAAQRQHSHDPLRYAVLAAAREEWDTFRDLIADMGLSSNYQPPVLLQGCSILIEGDFVFNFFNKLIPPTRALQGSA